MRGAEGGDCADVGPNGPFSAREDALGAANFAARPGARQSLESKK